MGTHATLGKLPSDTVILEDPAGHPGSVEPKYLQLRKRLEAKFPSCLNLCAEGPPQVPRFFAVMVAEKLVHSEERGNGYVDTKSKFLKLGAAVEATWALG
ncbi:selenoprotein W [Oryctolagus cuniculus]|uniref:selenoprotein W n=1 Tax=Oryctolagus cuniculus TaxID=9986 RepID=UPI0007EE4056|nr:selenoprotein W [Oryctolagus cuniculus]